MISKDDLVPNAILLPQVDHDYLKSIVLWWEAYSKVKYSPECSVAFEIPNRFHENMTEFMTSMLGDGLDKFYDQDYYFDSIEVLEVEDFGLKLVASIKHNHDHKAPTQYILIEVEE